MKGDAEEARMLQALLSGYIAASIMKMPLTPPVKLEPFEAGEPIKIRLASGMLATIVVDVAPLS